MLFFSRILFDRFHWLDDMNDAFPAANAQGEDTIPMPASWAQSVDIGDKYLKFRIYFSLFLTAFVLAFGVAAGKKKDAISGSFVGGLIVGFLTLCIIYWRIRRYLHFLRDLTMGKARSSAISQVKAIAIIRTFLFSARWFLNFLLALLFGICLQHVIRCYNDDSCQISGTTTIILLCSVWGGAAVFGGMAIAMVLAMLPVKFIAHNEPT